MRPEPPDGYTARPATTDDAAAVAGLVLATEWKGSFAPETAEQDIREDWRTVDLESDSLLVFASDGRLAAAADIQDREHVRLDVFVVVHPDFQGKGLGTYLLGATGARTEELADLATGGASVNVYRPTIATNPSAARILLAHGYSEARRFYTMHRSLDDIESPNLPDGIAVRNFVTGRDEETFYEAQSESFRDHWGDEEESFDEWKKHHLDRADFDESLWLIAEDTASGEIAGVVISRPHAPEEGWIDILGVRRRWRGRGLGEALLRTAFVTFRERGMSSVGLGVDTESPTGATRLYERTGMEVREELVLFKREIRTAGS